MTRPGSGKLPETPYIRALSVLRQAPEGASEALMDRLLSEFLTEADVELQKVKTEKSRQKLYIASITEVIDYLNVRGVPHEVLSAFLAELTNRASNFEGRFTFDAQVGKKAKRKKKAATPKDCSLSNLCKPIISCGFWSTNDQQARQLHRARQ
jgi:hypothetical protein